jgi:hypothetical protein
MGCTDCTKAYELIELRVGSSKDAVKSARKEWSKNLHPDIWQNRPGWKGAADQLANINVAIDHLLQCDGAGSTSYTSSAANPKSVSEAEVPQVLRQANEALRQAMEAMRKANHGHQTQAEAGAAWRGVVERYQASSTMRAAPVIEDRATVEKDVEQPQAIPATSSPTPVSPAAPAAPASTASQTAIPDETQVKVETAEKYCGVNAQEWNLSCQKWPGEVSVSPRPAYVQAVPDVAPTIRNQYGFAQRTGAVGYAAMQEPEAQPTRRATILILSNGPAMYVTNVWYSGERIMFTMRNGSRRSLGLEHVNFRSTIEANHQIGVGFNPPQGYRN